MSEQSQKRIMYDARSDLETSMSPTADNRTGSAKHDAIDVVKFACALQATDNIDELIRTYSDNVQAIIPHSSISFENRLMAIDIALGSRATHSCSYRMLFSNESLGLLSLTRDRPFAESELARFEHLLSIFFYPLGNAIYN